MNPQPKPIRERDEPRVDFARQGGCIIAKFHKCDGPVDAHHVIAKGQGRVGSKVSDRRTVGLCRAGHKLANRRDRFEQMFPILFEEEIVRINRDFDALPKGAGKVREKTSKIVAKCECGQVHAKVDIVDGVARWWCPRARDYRETANPR
jgi:hypothetical protein